MSEGFQAAQSTPSLALLSHERKSPAAFRTISEVADDLSLPQHVLRFWESKFQQIKPLKRGGGRRYYRPEDVKVIYDIKDLLYNQGFTIRGVQKLLRENSAGSVARSKVAQPQLPMSVQTLPLSTSSPIVPPVLSVRPSTGLTPELRREMENVLAELRAIRKILHQSGI